MMRRWVSPKDVTVWQADSYFDLRAQHPTRSGVPSGQ
jgi:hypothetical protein